MSNHDPELGQLIQAVCWKLGLENDSDESKKKWEEFTDSGDHQDKTQKIIKNLVDISADICKEVYEIKFDIIDENLPNDEVAKRVCTLVNILITCQDIDTKKTQSLPNSSEEIFKTAISKALEKKSPQLPDCSQANKRSEYIRESEASSSTECALPSTTKKISNDHGSRPVKASSTPRFSEHSSEENMVQSKSTSTPITSPWQYHPVPDRDKEPEPHDEFYSKSDQSPEGLKLIGARVRGKMHKHQGTNCDDWFQFDTIGKWTIIAVSDGAGSKKFSRIGAKISCKAAVESLKNSLHSFSLCETAKTDLENDFSRDYNWMFKGEKARHLQETLYKALQVAQKKVKDQSNLLKNYPPYNKALEKKELDIKDLSATLLLAIHTKIQVENSTSYDFVLTCQVGDGMLAAISHEYNLELLGKPDIGEHGGQTDFLTSAKKLEPSNLVQKTRCFIGNLKALMIMTDGVSDDYFPNDPGMLELYGDLVLNRVINIPDVDAKKSEKKSQKINDSKSKDDVTNNQKNFQDEVERLVLPGSEEPQKVSIRSIAKYAEQSHNIKEVLTSPDLLSSGTLRHQMCQECEQMESDEKLKIWLDSYYRRGSFDDRTLVVLYREED